MCLNDLTARVENINMNCFVCQLDRFRLVESIKRKLRECGGLCTQWYILVTQEINHFSVFSSIEKRWKRKKKWKQQKKTKYGWNSKLNWHIWHSSALAAWKQWWFVTIFAFFFFSFYVRSAYLLKTYSLISCYLSLSNILSDEEKA